MVWLAMCVLSRSRRVAEDSGHVQVLQGFCRLSSQNRMGNRMGSFFLPVNNGHGTVLGWDAQAELSDSGSERAKMRQIEDELKIKLTSALAAEDLQFLAAHGSTRKQVVKTSG